MAEDTFKIILAACDAQISRTGRPDTGPVSDLVSWCSETRRHGELLVLRRALSELIGCGRCDALQLEHVGGWLRDALTWDAPNDLDAYMQAMEFDRRKEARYWLPRRRQLMCLCRALEWLETAPEAEFLNVSMPPRTGKSTGCGFFMTWHFGRSPRTSNLMTGYADKLTKHFYSQAIEFVTDPEYRFSEVFPDAPLVWQSAEDSAFSLQRKGSYPTCTCRTIGGTLTGATEVGEGGILYADDLIKDNIEAKSPTRLESKWDMYVNQAYDRRKTGARQLMVGTRWAVGDVQGRMMELHRGEDGFRDLTIPALDPKTGESNFDYLYGVGFDRHYYLDMRKTTDQYTYDAKYNGRPKVREGQLFAPDSLTYYTSLPAGEPERVIAVVDTKGRGTDYCAMPVVGSWRQDPDRWYMFDAVCENGLPAVADQKVAAAIVRDRVQVCQFESNREGASIRDRIAKAVEEAGGLCSCTLKYTGTNKETRIMAASQWVCDHVVFRDPSGYEYGDYMVFMDQLTGFSLDGKNEHDDAPDSLSMLAELLASSVRRKAEPVRRPF